MDEQLPSVSLRGVSFWMWELHLEGQSLGPALDPWLVKGEEPSHLQVASRMIPVPVLEAAPHRPL